MEFKIEEIKDVQIEELKKFHKSYFDIDSIVNTASELKYTNELKQLLNKELNNPSVDFVKFFAKQVYPSVVTQKILEQFTELTKKSIQQYISDLYTERLKIALSKENQNNIEKKINDSENTFIEETSKSETTQEELEAFMIVKTILRQKIAVDRIYYRDAQSYFTIILDDTNRKLICRLYLSKRKFISFIGEDKRENKIEISSIDDIFMYSEEILKIAETYI